MGKTQTKQKQLPPEVLHNFLALLKDSENSVKNTVGGVL